MSLHRDPSENIGLMETFIAPAYTSWELGFIHYYGHQNSVTLFGIVIPIHGGIPSKLVCAKMGIENPTSHLSIVNFHSSGVQTQAMWTFPLILKASIHHRHRHVIIHFIAPHLLSKQPYLGQVCPILQFMVPIPRVFPKKSGPSILNLSSQVIQN